MLTKPQMTAERIVDTFAIQVMPYSKDGKFKVSFTNIDLDINLSPVNNDSSFITLRNRYNSFVEWMEKEFSISKIIDNVLSRSRVYDDNEYSMLFRVIEQHIDFEVIKYEAKYQTGIKDVLYQFLTGEHISQFVNNGTKESKHKIITVLDDYTSHRRDNGFKILEGIKEKFGDNIIVRHGVLTYLRTKSFEKNYDYMRDLIAEYYKSSDIVLINHTCDSATFMFGLYLGSVSYKDFELYGFCTEMEIYPYGIGKGTEPVIEHGLFLTKLY